MNSEETLLRFGTYFGLIIAEAWVIITLLKGRNRLALRMGGALATAAIGAAFWYFLEVRYGWPMPSRSRKSAPDPIPDAFIVFAMGLVVGLSVLFEAKRRHLAVTVGVGLVLAALLVATWYLLEVHYGTA